MAVLLDLAGVCTGLQVTPGMPVDKSAHDAAVDSVLDAKLKLSNEVRVSVSLETGVVEVAHPQSVDRTSAAFNRATTLRHVGPLSQVQPGPGTLARRPAHSLYRR
jgi:hypothetical protein